MTKSLRQCLKCGCDFLTHLPYLNCAVCRQAR
jgi:hypothetical protein